MNLREVQALFWRAIAWPTGVRDFLEHADEKTRRAFAEVFAGTEEFDAVARMSVYADGYFWRLHGVVVDQLPVTAWLAGAERFHDFVTDYVLARPSHDPDVRRFAAGIPEALREHALQRAQPGLAEVAAIEWAIVLAIDGPDDAVLRPEDLAAIPVASWPELSLQAVRTAALLPCPLDFASLVAAKESGEPPPAAVERVAPPHEILVWRRPTLAVHWRVVDAAESAALSALLRGCTFAEMCSATPDGSAERVVALLQRWLADGLLARLPTPASG